MAPTPNPRVLYAKIPTDSFLVAGEHLVYDPTPTIDLEQDLKGGFLTKTLLLSPEPYMRERLRDPSIPSYSTPMKVGQPIVGGGLVVVVRSEKEGVKAGDYMFGFTPWEAYTVQPYPVPNPQGAFPWTSFCSCLGLPGFTAFVGIDKFADAKPGETIYVSSGASGVGSMVIQLAKIKGLKVIASASTEDKVAYMRGIGADAAFNYKTTSVQAELETHGPLDIYFDNVCGDQLEAALDHMNQNGRVICCGAISEYNISREERYGIKNMSLLFKRRLRLQGFLISDHLADQARFLNEIPPLLAQGKVKSEEHIFSGLENGVQAFLSLFDGSAKAKPVIVVDAQYGA
ncbi:hypothetical protein B0H19DRAFT_922385 [Mycena capillaripes]|nr:hypothetical protein B0H19DRAFT_922385 [Mycena capillaripes]